MDAESRLLLEHERLWTRTTALSLPPHVLSLYFITNISVIPAHVSIVH